MIRSEAVAPLRRVLVAEDDPIIRFFIQVALECRPLVLECRSSVAEAREVLSQGGLDLLVTDLSFADGHGLELVERAQASRPPIPSLVFSAGLDARTREQVQAAGAAACLEKPSRVDDLLAEVDRLLSGPPVPKAGTIDRLGPPEALEAFRAASQQQFRRDRETGAACLASRDGQRLRRLAHDLKSVLALWGDEAGSDLARALEHMAAPLAEARGRKVGADATLQPEEGTWLEIAARWRLLDQRLAARGNGGPGDGLDPFSGSR